MGHPSTVGGVGAKARLGLLVGALVVLGVVLAVWSPVSRDELRALIEPLGWGGPFVFVVLSALLGTALVPGPVLAGASGLLFGTAVGFLVTASATVLSAVLALLIARHGGRPGVVELEQPRVQRFEALLQRHGLLAVIVQRLAPAVPDAPCSYLYGLAGLSVQQVALGTLLGATPRSLSYTALGDGLGSGNGTLTAVAAGALVLTGVVGAAVAAVAFRRARA